MSVNDLVLVQGMHDTRAALARWNARPWSALGPWLALSLAIALMVLTSIYVIATQVPADSSRFIIPGVNSDAGFGDYKHVLYRNSLVLALHAMACVAGFMAGSSLPQVAEGYSGLWRRVHELAGPLAIAFVGAATVFSLFTQAYALGGGASTLAAQLGVSPLVLILGLLPHALPELFALFLPLAAWTIASRRDEWHDLLAATFATVAIAIPILIASGLWEIYCWPLLLEAVSPLA